MEKVTLSQALNSGEIGSQGEEVKTTEETKTVEYVEGSSWICLEPNKVYRRD